MQDHFQNMGSSWDEWQEWDPAKWQEWDEWQDWGSNSSWWDDGWHVLSKSEQNKYAAIKARQDKQEKKAAKPAHFASDAFDQWRAGTNEAIALHAHVPIQPRPLEKPRKQVHHQMLSYRL